MRVYQKDVLGAISSGKNTRGKIRQFLGWDADVGRKKVHYHVNSLKKKGRIVEQEGIIKLTIGPNRIANPNKTRALLQRIKTPFEEVRIEAARDLKAFSNKWIITDPTAWKILLDILENPEFEDIKAILFECFEKILNEIRGTKLIDEMKTVLESNPELLSDTVMKKDTPFPKNRAEALKLLVEINEEKYCDTVFYILQHPDDPHLGEIDTRGTLEPNNSNLIGTTIYETVSGLSPENLERVHDFVFGVLEGNRNNKKLQKYCRFLLEKIRDTLYPSANSSH